MERQLFDNSDLNIVKRSDLVKANIEGQLGETIILTEEQFEKAVKDHDLEIYSEVAVLSFRNNLEKAIDADPNDLEKAKKDLSKLIKTTVVGKDGVKRTVYVKRKEYKSHTEGNRAEIEATIKRQESLLANPKSPASAKKRAQQILDTENAKLSKLAGLGKTTKQGDGTKGLSKEGKAAHEKVVGTTVKEGDTVTSDNPHMGGEFKVLKVDLQHRRVDGGKLKKENWVTLEGPDGKKRMPVLSNTLTKKDSNSKYTDKNSGWLHIKGMESESAKEGYDIAAELGKRGEKEKAQEIVSKFDKIASDKAVGEMTDGSKTPSNDWSLDKLKTFREKLNIKNPNDHIKKLIKDTDAQIAAKSGSKESEIDWGSDEVQDDLKKYHSMDPSEMKMIQKEHGFDDKFLTASYVNLTPKQREVLRNHKPKIDHTIRAAEARYLYGLAYEDPQKALKEANKYVELYTGQERYAETIGDYSKVVAFANKQLSDQGTKAKTKTKIALNPNKIISHVEKDGKGNIIGGGSMKVKDLKSTNTTKADARSAKMADRDAYNAKSKAPKKKFRSTPVDRSKENAVNDQGFSEKDKDRLQSMMDKYNHDDVKFEAAATRMANSIKSREKAMARGRAAEDINAHKVAAIFFNRAKQLR